MFQVVVVGPSSSEAVSQLTTEAQGHVTSLLGQLVVRFDPSDPVQRNGFIAGRRPELLQMKSSPPAAYLCRHRSCSAPVESAADLRRLLDRWSVPLWTGRVIFFFFYEKVYSVKTFHRRKKNCWTAQVRFTFVFAQSPLVWCLVIYSGTLYHSIYRNIQIYINAYHVFHDNDDLL